KIFRASLTKNITEKQIIEFGGEAAINTFDKTFSKLERDFMIDPFVLDSSDNVEIKENRYEIFANHSYNISNNMVLQSSLTTEFSKIVADNIFDDGSISRRDTNFTYLKPRMNLRYDFTDKDQLRLTAEKKVSQLNFNNFVTRFDSQTEEIRLGNTNIRPEQVWEFSAAFEHRLPNDTGSIEAEVFYRSYKDHISRVDFTEYEDFGGNPIGVDDFFALSPNLALRDMIDFTSKSGNIDDANAYGLKLISNIRLGFVGLPQATFSTSYTYERRRTTDQFTGLERNFERMIDHQLDVNFRHDITEWDFSYGFRGTFRSDAATNDINYHWPYSRNAYLSMFAEYNIFKGVKMRVEAKQLSGKRATSNIFWYNDHIRFNDFNQRVNRIETTPREIEVTLQGTF
ncbi:MAG: TonB-dependent receptor, partial [Kordiimonadaceae bacterium]|nr:TonB-dependent receptor [Kordiimonadaceae bacterium]